METTTKLRSFPPFSGWVIRGQWKEMLELLRIVESVSETVKMLSISSSPLKAGILVLIKSDKSVVINCG